MRYTVMAVRDSKAEAYMRPMFVQSVGMGIRAFEDELSRDDPQNMMFTHPEDFTLWLLGTWDDADGSFDLQPTPQLLTSGS